jgi:pyridoxal phosphate enzyme (YggS family)
MSVKECFERLQERIEKAKARSFERKITLIGVTKHASFEQMMEAHFLQIKDFGENRYQKALGKIPLFPKDIRWHFIGPIQSNKAVEIASTFSVVHSVSSLKLAKIFSLTALQKKQKIPVFFQIDHSQSGIRNGFKPEEFISMQEDLLSLEGLQIEGLMTMAPFTQDVKEIRSVFRALALLQRKFPGRYPSLSMGMTNDFEIAIEEGATHLRIGSALFGHSAF